MSKFELKHRASQLRKSGASVSEVGTQLGISKSTASLWCRDIILSKNQQFRLHKKMIEAGHKGRLLGALSNRRKKENSVRLCELWAGEAFSSMSERDFFMAGVTLYWAEGSKSTKSNLSFVNSDPNMVIFMYKWFEKFFAVTPEDFIPRIFINKTHGSRITDVLNFWSNLLRLPKDAFRKTIFIQTKQRKVYENHDKYYGLLSLRIRRSSSIKYKVLALIDLVRNADVAQVARASHS